MILVMIKHSYLFTF